ncbi:lysozyme C, tracheal isozyme [Tetranychus urticae]|uniref:lysozyme n=1 Tax=Tetranychus urticae TaxID=32264 RepID=T1KDS6_TETUR|nr:lysozyme C, tracheal isozyme [Tetranychus urticae]
MFPIIVTLLLVNLSAGKIYDRCELANQLLSVHNFPESQLADWLCLIEGESSYNTGAISQPEYDGVRDYGLFQINSRYWCGPPNDINVCGINCLQLVDDDITDDIACVRKIYQVHGFDAWVAWRYKCKGRNLKKYIKGCSNIQWTSPVNVIDKLLSETEKSIQTIDGVPKSRSNKLSSQFASAALNEVANYLNNVLVTMKTYF